MSDKLRQSRVKIYCPKCEEVYIPPAKSSLDGAYFGASLSHMFLQSYAKSIVLPPKVYYYQPKLYGFQVAGKRGSKYYQPATQEVQLTQEKQAATEKAMEPPRLKFKEETKSQGRQNGGSSTARNDRSKSH